MRSAHWIVVSVLWLAIGAAAAFVAGRSVLADGPDAETNSPITAEQKAALAAVDVRLDAARMLAAKIDDSGYRSEVDRQLDDLKKTRLGLEKNFDQGRYETLMHSVISRYQVIALWLKSPPLPAREYNALTSDEEAAGWRLLFDGKTLAGWRGYRSETAPESWRVENGSLLSRHEDGRSSGDIITAEQFDDFELLVDWKMTKGNNSGIIYRATEQWDYVWQSGPEFQILDNAGHLDRLNPLASTGACYAVFPPTSDMSQPVGEWNTARIVASGKHVEHWLNGSKVVEYDVGSDEWKEHVKTSKFFAAVNGKIADGQVADPQVAGGRVAGGENVPLQITWGQIAWGQGRRGHIALQDYGGAIEFRNIKIRACRTDAR